ncbi:MAG: thiol:disulfide interchange protein, partial [Bacteroidaceae bacterium]|nr:thiol:disulfide interchange protein [Bacteroidaceae bacterium]
MKKSLFLTLALVMLSCVTALAQVNFSVNYKKVSANEIDIVFSGKADAGWHVYSTNIPDGGPNPAIFGVDKKDGVELVGGLKPGSGAKTAFDPMFEMNITYFENSCTFTQRVRLTKKDYSLEGYLEFSACNDMNCLPPTAVSCKLNGTDGPDANAKAKEAEAQKKEEQAPAEEAKAAAEASLTAQPDTAAVDTAAVAPAVSGGDNALNMDALWTPVVDELKAFGQESISDSSLWYIFIMGFVGGLVALFTPCVWPIIPMTVSFFLKRAGNRRKGIRDAMIYGVSIVAIYVGLGLIITSIFGANALNDLSTNAFFNILFLLMLVVFAASFFGGFEIALPSSWGAAIDGKAEKATGLLSIFLMAFTLALVSFSCTG